MNILILVLYFIILFILSIFGAHRYYLLYLYHKNKDKKIKPKGKFENLPGVTIQLPLYNELYVAERLINAVCNFNYPKNKMEIQVLDDSTDETQKIVLEVVKRYKEKGFDIKYIHRDNRIGYKAGALDEGLKVAEYDYCAIFDADFIPPKDFLKRTIHYFTDSEIGMVQIRWGHINRNYSLLTEVQTVLLDGHFVIESTVRNRTGRFFNFNGTAGIWRKQAIIDGGGWQHDTLTEDLDLSYRVQLRGWKFVYLPDMIAPAELPVNIKAFKTQQHRWAKGAIQTAKKLIPTIFKANIPLKNKIEAFFHLYANIAYLFMIPLSVLIFPTVIIRRGLAWNQMILIDIPFLLLATFSFSSFYIVAQKEYLKTWTSKIKFLPFVSAIGIGLSVNNAIAVLEGLFDKESEFVRTPKYGVKKNGEEVRTKKYKSKKGYLPYLELILGLYFTATVVVSLMKGIYLTIPFLFIFQYGYLYMAIFSLTEGINFKTLLSKRKNLNLAE
jgi:cellulose synthase/poly-beta-1,6-N-acetylglucosamine synthase-like glycosyltransferase